jgi:hypothetical protein
MMTKNRSISHLCGFALGGLLVGLPVTAALAADDEPTTAAEAQARAQDYREQADHYRSQGGAGYTSGRVQGAEAEAAKYSALAEQWAAQPAATPPPPPSPEVEHYTELAAHYRLQGGVAYKAGLVRWAEEDKQRAEAKQQAEVKQQPYYETTPVPAAPSTDAPNSGP